VNRRLLLVSGSLRRRSTNTAVLRSVQGLVSDETVAVVYECLGGLPHFNPDDDIEPLPPPVAALRAEVRGADMVLFSTPEYAGALPGSFKNVLDWMIGDDQTGSIYRKPVAWINASPRGAVNAHNSLRKVLGYAGAVIVEAACVDVPVTGEMIGEDGTIIDPSSRAAILGSVETLAAYTSGQPAS
jgi:chromate reductase